MKDTFKVIARNSEESVTINFYGQPANISVSKSMRVKPWDFVKLGFTMRQDHECNGEVIAAVVKVLKPEVKRR